MDDKWILLTQSCFSKHCSVFESSHKENCHARIHGFCHIIGTVMYFIAMRMEAFTDFELRLDTIAYKNHKIIE